MRRKKKAAAVWYIFAVPAAILAALLMLESAIGNLMRGCADEGRDRLEDAVRRAAVTCYASEGIYPPTLDYLKDHYSLQVDENQYTVHYEIFADNLMPDITVLKNGD